MACLFCQIANGEIPSKIVYENDTVLAFEDVNPQAPTHILVIPRNHIESLNELTPDQAGLMGELILTAKDIARERGIADDGYRIVANCNAQGGQTVFHVHLHLLGGRFMQWPPG